MDADFAKNKISIQSKSFEPVGLYQHELFDNTNFQEFYVHTKLLGIHTD